MTNYMVTWYLSGISNLDRDLTGPDYDPKTQTTVELYLRILWTDQPEELKKRLLS